MYNIYVSIDDFPGLSTGNNVAVTTQLNTWITDNDLTDKVQIFPNNEGNAAAIISEQSITTPSLVLSKQEVGSENVVYEKVAVGLEAILALPADKVAEIHDFHTITTQPAKGGVLRDGVALGRRIR